MHCNCTCIPRYSNARVPALEKRARINPQGMAVGQHWDSHISIKSFLGEKLLARKWEKYRRRETTSVWIYAVACPEDGSTNCETDCPAFWTLVFQTLPAIHRLKYNGTSIMSITKADSILLDLCKKNGKYQNTKTFNWRNSHQKFPTNSFTENFSTFIIPPKFRYFHCNILCQVYIC